MERGIATVFEAPENKVLDRNKVLAIALAQISHLRCLTFPRPVSYPHAFLTLHARLEYT